MIGSRVMHRDSRRGRLVVRRRREPRASGLAYGRESRERQLRLECSARVHGRGSVGLIHGGDFVFDPRIDHPLSVSEYVYPVLLTSYVWFVTAVPGALGLTQEPGFFFRCTAHHFCCRVYGVATTPLPSVDRRARCALSNRIALKAPASALWSGVGGRARALERPGFTLQYTMWSVPCCDAYDLYHSTARSMRACVPGC